MARTPLAVVLLVLLCVGAASAQSLRVVAIDCDQGSSTLLVSPTGVSMLIDGGPDESGWINSPSGPGPVAQALAAAGVSQLDYTLLTHYHSDHYEGLTELAQHNYLKAGAKAYDRGNSPAPENGFTAPINAYISAMGAKRTTITPGTLVDLGGGVSVKCVVVAGVIAGGPTVNTSGSAQLENSNSIALLVTYGNFELFIGGDLTGGGGGTTDVESVLAPFVGDVDVYIANHHGSSTSTNAAFLATTLPELSVASCGLHNPYGHPSTSYLNNVNKTSRSLLNYSTTGGADNDGFGNRGFVNSAGTLRIETDGNFYVVTPTVGTPRKIACDEIAPLFAPPQPGELRISEFLADPAAVPDNAGEWFEIANVSGFERNLAGLKLSQSNGTTDLYTFATPVLLKPGARFVFSNNGDSQRNGGAVAGHCHPFSTFFLDTSDSILLRNPSNATIDLLTYTSSFPDAIGIAAERKDLLGSTSTLANWAAATTPYGAGDKGTPGARNAADITNFPAQFVSQSALAVGGSWNVGFLSFNEPGDIYLGGLSQSTAPPLFELFGQTLPLQADSLLFDSLNLPGFIGFLDADGYGSTTVAIPNVPWLHGYAFFGAVGVYDMPTIAPGKVSTAVPLLIP